MMVRVISETRRIRYFVGGFLGSRGDCSAFRNRAWYNAILRENIYTKSFLPCEFIHGESGFAVIFFAVRSN